MCGHEHTHHIYREITQSCGASLEAQLVKNLPAMRETWVGSLGWEDPLKEGMATHSSIFILGNVGAMSGGSEGMMHWTSSRWKGRTGAKDGKSGMHLALQGKWDMKGTVC